MWNMHNQSGMSYSGCLVLEGSLSAQDALQLSSLVADEALKEKKGMEI